jgi:hypothetical protein
MSRPKKMHPPLKGDFGSILKAVAAGTGKVKGPVVKPSVARDAKPITPKPKKP